MYRAKGLESRGWEGCIPAHIVKCDVFLSASTLTLQASGGIINRDAHLTATDGFTVAAEPLVRLVFGHIFSFLQILNLKSWSGVRWGWDGVCIVAG